MTTRFEMAMSDAFADCSDGQRAAVSMPTAIASRWAVLRCGWLRSLARHRLQRSIAHLDDRLLADIGLGPQDLGFAERFARRHASGGDGWTNIKRICECAKTRRIFRGSSSFSTNVTFAPLGTEI